MKRSYSATSRSKIDSPAPRPKFRVPFERTRNPRPKTRNSGSEPQRATAFAWVRAADESAGLRVYHDRLCAAKALCIAADDLMPAAHQLVSGSLRDSGLQAHLGPFNMIEPRCGDRFLWRHAEVDP